MNFLTDRILDVINDLQNTNATIHEHVCVSPPPYYMDWLKKSYPIIPINIYDDLFCLQCMNGIQGKKPYIIQWNRFIDALVTMTKHKKRKPDQAIYINIFLKTLSPTSHYPLITS